MYACVNYKEIHENYTQHIDGSGYLYVEEKNVCFRKSTQ